MSPTGQSYGIALPDQVDRIADVFDAHLGLIYDVRDLYRERVALEREYATKLQALARKASEKKVKSTTALVLGDEPTKVWGESALRKSTIDSAYSAIIASMTLSAQDHINLSEALTLQVIDVLKSLEKRSEDTKKKQMQFYQKLLSERDRIYSDRAKSKQKYDEECVGVEAYRLKQGHSGDRHAERAAKQYEAQQVDVLNAKNIYLISIAVANATKEKFYSEDLPSIENSFQELQTRLVDRFVKILIHAQVLQQAHYDTLKNRVISSSIAISDVVPAQDQDLFIEHNIRPFVAPTDWSFEPCSSHYDTGDMSVESAPKVFIQNKLAKCRGKLQEIVPLIQAKDDEVNKYTKLVAAYIVDRSLGDIDDISDSCLDAKQQLTFYTSSERILKSELDVITAALGDDEGAQQPHSFKSSSFSIPTSCSYCNSSIWGLSKQGKTCRTCGLNVHTKCELKVPANCSGRRRASGVPLTKSSTRNSATSSTSSKLTPSSFTKADSSIGSQDSHPSARVVFDFTPTSPFELAVSDGLMVRVLEEDDGSGWVKVVDNEGRKGLVPASYIELAEETKPPLIPLSSKPNLRKGKQARGVYDYEAQGPDELGITEDEIIELTNGPNGGQNYADGWWEGTNMQGKRGIFPSNYVELI